MMDERGYHWQERQCFLWVSFSLSLFSLSSAHGLSAATKEKGGRQHFLRNDKGGSKCLQSGRNAGWLTVKLESLDGLPFSHLSILFVLSFFLSQPRQPKSSCIFTNNVFPPSSFHLRRDMAWHEMACYILPQYLCFPPLLLVSSMLAKKKKKKRSVHRSNQKSHTISQQVTRQAKTLATKSNMEFI